MKRALRISGGLLAAALIGGCATPRQSVEFQGDMPASPDEIAKWRDKNGLAIASGEEVALAKQCEARFVGQRAAAANGGLKIVFKLGSMVGSGYSNLSTTSTYSLLDGNNRKLAGGPGCINSGQAVDGYDRGEQRAWFSPDGKIAVVYEYANYCHGPEPLTIVFYEDKENPGSWRTRFLRLPQCGLGIHDEGAHAECRGIVGDELLIDANTNDGKVMKKKFEDIEEHFPFPFTIG